MGKHLKSKQTLDHDHPQRQKWTSHQPHLNNFQFLFQNPITPQHYSFHCSGLGIGRAGDAVTWLPEVAYCYHQDPSHHLYPNTSGKASTYSRKPQIDFQCQKCLPRSHLRDMWHEPAALGNSQVFLTFLKTSKSSPAYRRQWWLQGKDSAGGYRLKNQNRITLSL